ncbi:MAG: S9 family peptidase, partial [Phycisphaerae bacterium]|nr:S9 family peptidase [Gemmatimonadaceae bacterium]
MRSLTTGRLAQVAIALATLTAIPPLFAQVPAAGHQLTAADYARAEKFLAFSTSPLVYGMGVVPTWLPDERFTYRVAQPNGSRPLVLVDPAKSLKTNCATNANACPPAPAPAAAPLQLPGMSVGAWSPDR